MNAVLRRPDSATIRYKALWIGGGITLIVLIILFVVDKTNHLQIQLSNYLQLFSCGAVTTGLVYTAIALQYNYLSHMERLTFDLQNILKKEEREDAILRTQKVQLTFEITSEWFKGTMAVNVEKSRRFLQPFKDTLHEQEHFHRFKKILEEQEDERRSLMSILNYFENISLLLERDIIDEDCTKDAFKAVFGTYYRALKPYIDDIQRDNPRYFKSYVKIANSWLVKG